LLRVNEIFHSIQGESSHAGWPCVFVRLSGCNLRCAYCDTLYAHEEGQDMTLDQILSRVRRYRCSLVEVTGGEPLIQKDTPLLIERLLKSGYKVLLETNGSQDISRVPSSCIRIVDFKCPSSGHCEANDFENIPRLERHDEVKFVIGNREDYEYARELTTRIETVEKQVTVLFSAVFNGLKWEQLARWVLEDGLRVRLNVQLHKAIWDPHLRGV